MGPGDWGPRSQAGVNGGDRVGLGWPLQLFPAGCLPSFSVGTLCDVSPIWVWGLFPTQLGPNHPETLGKPDLVAEVWGFPAPVGPPAQSCWLVGLPLCQTC